MASRDPKPPHRTEHRRQSTDAEQQSTKYSAIEILIIGDGRLPMDEKSCAGRMNYRSPNVADRHMRAVSSDFPKIMIVVDEAAVKRCGTKPNYCGKYSSHTGGVRGRWERAGVRAAAVTAAVTGSGDGHLTDIRRGSCVTHDLAK